MVSDHLADKNFLSYFANKFIINERKNFFLAMFVVSMIVLQNVV